jgi:hypothetical protein
VKILSKIKSKTCGIGTKTPRTIQGEKCREKTKAR